MSNYVLYPILELKGYIILTVAALFLLTVSVLVMMGRRKQGLEAFGWQGLFLGRTKRELIGMALGISQVTYVFSMIFFFSPIGAVQLAGLAVLCIAKGAFSLSLTSFVGEVVFGLMTGIGLMAGNLLLDYMSETGIDLYIFAVWALLSLFLLQYSMYYFIKSLERMLRQHERTRQIQKEK